MTSHAGGPEGQSPPQPAGLLPAGKGAPCRLVYTHVHSCIIDVEDITLSL